MTNRYKNKRAKYAQNKESFDILSYSTRWTETERLFLYCLEISAIKKILYRRPYRGKTTAFKQKTVDAYWDRLMDGMPEGREPQIKQADASHKSTNLKIKEISG